MVEGPAGLHWRDARDGAAYAGFARLVASVFDVVLEPPAGSSMWSALACFDDAGRCVAGAEFGRLPLILDGAPGAAGCLRLVAVAPDWRGRGLFRALMERFLLWGEGQGLLLLYAAEPALYHRFGFAGVAQHAFAGPAPTPAAAPPARPLDPRRDRALVERMLAARAPVSVQVAVVGAAEPFLHRLASGDLLLAHLPGADALVVYEEDGDTLRLADVVAARIPALPAILGALPRRYTSVEALFPPDRLGWRGAPVAEDAGLMARGALPPAMARPFALPPTAEF